MEIGDFEKRSPLHVAVAATSCETARLLMEAGANPNARGLMGETPLHLANCSKHVRTILRYGADAHLKTDRFDGRNKTALEIMMSKKSCSSKVLLNQEITSNKNYGNYDNYTIIYDLQSFQHSVDEDYHGEMALVAKLLESGMATSFLLEHPVMEVFLTVKYELMRPVFVMNFIIFLTFTLLLTSLTLMMTFQGENCLKYHTDSNWYNCTDPFEVNHGTTAYNALYALTCTMLSILLLREVVQMIQCGYKYILDMENWIECAIFAIAVTYLTKLRANADIFDETVTRWAAVAVLLAWFEVTLLLGRLPGIGIYVYMVLHVTVMLAKLFLYFSFVSLGFVLAFYLLLPGNASFGHPLSAVIKVDVMMSGEFDFDDNFVFNDGENVLAQTVFFVFFITMTIVLTNLLIGMTVSKTEELLKQANMIKLKKMVAQILCLEDILSKSKQIRRLLPKPAKKWLNRKTRIFDYFDALKEGKKNINTRTTIKKEIRVSYCFRNRGTSAVQVYSLAGAQELQSLRDALQEPPAPSPRGQQLAEDDRHRPRLPHELPRRTRKPPSLSLRRAPLLRDRPPQGPSSGLRRPTVPVHHGEGARAPSGVVCKWIWV